MELGFFGGLRGRRLAAFSPEAAGKSVGAEHVPAAEAALSEQEEAQSVPRSRKSTVAAMLGGAFLAALLVSFVLTKMIGKAGPAVGDVQPGKEEAPVLPDLRVPIPSPLETPTKEEEKKRAPDLEFKAAMEPESETPGESAETAAKEGEKQVQFGDGEKEGEEEVRVSEAEIPDAVPGEEEEEASEEEEVATDKEEEASDKEEQASDKGEEASEEEEEAVEEEEKAPPKVESPTPPPKRSRERPVLGPGRDAFVATRAVFEPSKDEDKRPKEGVEPAKPSKAPAAPAPATPSARTPSPVKQPYPSWPSSAGPTPWSPPPPAETKPEKKPTSEPERPKPPVIKAPRPGELGPYRARMGPKPFIKTTPEAGK